MYINRPVNFRWIPLIYFWSFNIQLNLFQRLTQDQGFFIKGIVISKSLNNVFVSDKNKMLVVKSTSNASSSETKQYREAILQ